MAARGGKSDVLTTAKMRVLAVHGEEFGSSANGIFFNYRRIRGSFGVGPTSSAASLAVTMIDPEAGQTLFEDVVERFVRPHLLKRISSGELASDTLVYKFQVLLHENSHEVRLNDSVRGSLVVEKAPGRSFAAGDVVTVDDIIGIDSFDPHPDDVGVPHLTGLMHRDGWSLIFALGHGHATRLDFFERGLEFLETAKEAASAGRIGAFVDTALSSCELLAKAELLSSGPTVELVLDKPSHRAVTRPYHAWAALGNTERRFAQLLERLHELRGAGRYVERELKLDDWVVVAILSTLDDMREHVAKAVDDSRAELDTDLPQTFIATRNLRAGELVSRDDLTIFPL
jgi:hypothetical protein